MKHVHVYVFCLKIRIFILLSSRTPTAVCAFFSVFYFFVSLITLIIFLSAVRSLFLLPGSPFNERVEQLVNILHTLIF